MTSPSLPGFERSPDPATRRALFDLSRQLAWITPGTFIFGAWATAPNGFLILDGTLITNGVALYPNLAATFPSWVSGANLQLPNATGSVIMGGATPGVVSGSMTHTLTSANLPTHTHTIDHGHADTLAAPAHTHSIAHTHSYSYRRTTPTDQVGTGGTFRNLSVGSATTGASSAANSGGASATALTGSVTNFTGSSGNGGFSNTAVDHTPQNLTVKVAVKT